MRQTISRMYASRDQAMRVEHELRTNRLDRFDDIHVTTRDDALASHAGAGGAREAIVAALMKALVLRAHAQVYALGIERGGALLTVHAPFGTATAAMNILDSFDPIDSGLAETPDALPAWDEATPVSSALGIPVLLSNEASFSRFWNVPALTRAQRTTCTALGIPELSSSSGNFTGTFGIALLSDKPAPLSSLFGLPTLTKPR